MGTDPTNLYHHREEKEVVIVERRANNSNSPLREVDDENQRTTASSSAEAANTKKGLQHELNNPRSISNNSYTPIPVVDHNKDSEEDHLSIELPFDEMVLKRARSNHSSFELPIVEEGPPTSNQEKEWMSLAGRIELLLLEDQDEFGNCVNRRLQIICLPQSSSEHDHCTLFHHSPNSLLQDDSVLLEDEEKDVSSAEQRPISNMLEQIASTFLESCAAPCETVLPKSVLRKSGEERNVSRSVTFDNVEIREFNMTLGDHPSAVTGPPMAMDWDKEARVSSMPLQDYEENREPRRHRKQLKMSMKTRCGILQKEGNFTANEITQAWEEALQVRKQRRETLKGGMYEMVLTDVKESLNRKLERFSNGVSSLLLV